MKLGIMIFIVGVEGFILNNKNMILMLICLEMMLLGITVIVLTLSITLDDILGQIYGLYVIILAGAESAIGLSILVSFYGVRGDVNITFPGR